MKCTKCGEGKILSDFSPSPRHRNGFFPWCRLCKATYQLQYQDGLTVEERRAKDRAYRDRRDSDTVARAQYLSRGTAYSLRSRYNLTTSQVVELADHQKGVCAICGTPPDVSQKRGGLHVDHDHSTGKVRGLLCEPCNVGLGFFKDSTENLRSAALYLETPPTKTVVFTNPPPKPVRAGRQRYGSVTEETLLVCKHCGQGFRRRVDREISNRSKAKEGPFCGRKCSGTWSATQQPKQGIVHGTTTGYTSYKCRCSNCRQAHTEAERKRLQSKALTGSTKTQVKAGRTTRKQSR